MVLDKCITACAVKFPVRYWIMIMLFLSAYINYSTLSIVSKVLPSMVKLVDSATVATCLQDQVSSGSNGNESSAAEEESDTGERFDWDQHVQGLVLGAYFYGFLIGSLVGGPLSEFIGPLSTNLIAAITAGILNCVCALIAPVHWGGLFAARLITGTTGGWMIPAIQCLIGRWAPPQEKSKFVSMIMGNSTGTCFTWIFVGIVTKQFGWPWGFYIVSIQIVIYCILYFLITSDSPDQHRWISEEELKFIKESQGKSVSKGKVPPPYKAILTSFPFWTLCILQFGNLWGLHVQLTAVPKFMEEFIGFDIKKSGFLSALPHLVRLFTGVGFGFFADWLKSIGFTRLVILKGHVVLSNIVPGIIMGLMIFAGCNGTAVIVLLVVSYGINGAIIVTSLSNPTDLAPNFAGTLYGIVAFVGGTTGFLAPSVTGALLSQFGNTLTAWGLVFAIGGGMYISSGIFFIFFGSASIQPWNEKHPETSSS